MASFPVVGSPNMSVIEESSMVIAESLDEVSEGEVAVAAPITLSNRTETKSSVLGITGRGWVRVGMERLAGLGMKGTVLFSKILMFEGFCFLVIFEIL